MGRVNLSRSQLGETEHVAGEALELKGEHIHAITLGAGFHCTQTKRSRNIHQKKMLQARAFSRELYLDKRYKHFQCRFPDMPNNN